MDRHGPTGVIESAGKMDPLKAGGTLPNLIFVIEEDGLTPISAFHPMIDGPLVFNAQLASH